MKGCPHAFKPHCPMYVAMHTGKGGSCWPADNALQTGCAVDKGSSYAWLLARLNEIDFDTVAGCEAAAMRRQSDEQRRRNMRAAGLH